MFGSERCGWIRAEYRYEFLSQVSLSRRNAVPIDRWLLNRFSVNPTFRPAEGGKVLDQSREDESIVARKCCIGPVDEDRIASTDDNKGVKYHRSVVWSLFFPRHVMPGVGD